MAYAEHFGVVGAFFIPHLGEFGFREPARNRVDVAGLQVFRIGRAVYIGVLIAAVDGRIAVFVADSLKGQAGVMLGLLLVGTPLAAVIGGLCAILGHSFSLFLRFHGGKGVATSLGVLTMLMGQVTFIIFVIWLTIVYVSRYVSLGSVVAAFLAPFLAALYGYPTEYVLFTAVAAILVILRHRENIGRLMHGTENKI